MLKECYPLLTEKLAKSVNFFLMTTSTNYKRNKKRDKMSDNILTKVRNNVT